MCGSVNEKFWKLGFISVLSSTVNAFWRAASVNGNACTLPGSRPDMLGCGPPVSGSKPNPPLLTDLKSGNITGLVASGSAYLLEGIWL